MVIAGCWRCGVGGGGDVWDNWVSSLGKKLPDERHPFWFLDPLDRSKCEPIPFFSSVNRNFIGNSCSIPS
jgi:hypothetical protein